MSLPKNFRVDYENHCSSSAQPLPCQLETIVNLFHPIPVIFVDLREEPHFLEYEHEILTEEEVCERMGFNYLHIPIRDHSFPTLSELSKFIFPRKYWIHFHCKAGKGRSTLAMCLHEIIKGTYRTLDDILDRQASLGGTHLKKSIQSINPLSIFNYPYHVYRYKKLKEFYDRLYDI